MYYIPLKISNDLVNKEVLFQEINQEQQDFYMTRNWFGRTNILLEDFHRWLESLGCSIFFAEVFYTPPGGRMLWHIDTEAPSDFVKINFVWGSQHHVMQWGIYNRQEPKEISLTSASTKYLNFEPNEVTLVKSYKIETPTIVNIGTPHRVINTDKTGRWCLSVNVHKDGNRIPISKAEEVFSEYALG